MVGNRFRKKVAIGSSSIRRRREESLLTESPLIFYLKNYLTAYGSKLDGSNKQQQDK